MKYGELLIDELFEIEDTGEEVTGRELAKRGPEFVEAMHEARLRGMVAFETKTLVAAIRQEVGGTRGRADLEVLDEVELAGLLGVAVSTLQSWRSERQGPAFVRAGRSILYRKAAVIQWLEQAETATGSVVQPSDGRRRR